MFSVLDFDHFIGQARNQSDTMCLATVIAKKGSSYSQVGWRMLVDSQSATLGSLSGGCIEGEIIENAVEVCEKRFAKVLSFDTALDPDGVFGYNTGCAGIIDILLQPIDLMRSLAGIASLLCWSNEEVWFCTIIEPSKKQASIWVRLSSGLSYSYGPGNAESMSNFLSRVDYLSWPQYAAMHFHKGIQIFAGKKLPSPIIYIYGAGRCAGILYRLAMAIGVKCQIFDKRQVFMQGLQKEFKIKAQFLEPADISQVANPGTYWVLMSHNLEIDHQLIEGLFLAKPSYLGVLGSKKRLSFLYSRLKKNRTRQTVSIHCPIGLDIGDPTPEGIALSILAEIKKHQFQEIGEKQSLQQVKF